MYKHLYSEFLNSHKNKIHMAAHSHHFWPDISRQGHMESYEKSLELSDAKWDYIFGQLVPDVQTIISKLLNFSRPEDIAFAPNTHDLITKLISCFLSQEKVTILTTTSEFHSLSRQLKRLSEEDQFEVICLDNESTQFKNELVNTLTNQKFDLVIMSQVFFNSGNILGEDSIEKIIQLKGNAHFILDAYHGFCALPFDIKKYEDDLYYLAGGYKYAQAGEGVCFLTIPNNCRLRPLFTGWFASFSTLEEKSSGPVAYDNSGMRFWGSTIDFTAFYRFRAVWNQFLDKGITIAEIDKYVKGLQEMFLKDNPMLPLFTNLELSQQGHFLTINLESPSKTQELHENLAKKGLLTDFRGTRLRFGFAPYLNQDEVLLAKSYLYL